MKIVALWLIFLLPLSISAEEEWLKAASKRIDANAANWAKEQQNKIPDSKAISWVKKQLKQDSEVIKLRSQQASESLTGEKCVTGNLIEIPEKNLYIFMSFSVPVDVWVSLSQEIEGYKATFVLCGLPNNSFKEFSKRILKLNELGVTAPIEINPTLFKEHQIEQVPTFLYVGEQESYTVSGNISLAWALNKMGVIP